MAINEILGFSTQQPQGSFTVCQYCRTACRREDSDSESNPETESEESNQNSSGESSEDDRHGYGGHGGYGRYKYELAATCDGRCNGIIPTCGACIEDPSTERPGG